MMKLFLSLTLLMLLFSPLPSAAQAAHPVITPDNAAQVVALAEVRGTSDGLDWPLWVVAFNADGTRLAVGNDNNEVVLFSVSDSPPYLTEERVLRGHRGPVYSLAFHPDGQRLASGGSDRSIIVWDMATGEIVQTLTTSPSGTVFGLAYTPDRAQLWCATSTGLGWVSGERCAHLGQTREWIYSVTFSSNGALMAYGDTTIRNTETNQELIIPTRRSWSDSYRSSRSKVVFSADGGVLLNSGSQQYTVFHHLDDLINPVTAGDSLLALSPDGRLAAGRGLVITDTHTGKRVFATQISSGSSIEGLLEDPHDAAFSPDGRLIVTANQDGTLRIWGVPSR
ncbi:MAG: hypothetical protein MUF38_17285 [Anaerolineae bacterium]|jgi:DNA-binding beta-propeller fold protein YncE|nr:hypothetical protein [Anaerolineae bacterium]